jgi:hypothetical protein
MDISDSPVSASEAPQVPDLVVGIDPGASTGVAVYSRRLGRLTLVKTRDFWSAYDFIQALGAEVGVEGLEVVVEVPKVAGGFSLYHRFKEGAEHVKEGGPRQKVAASIGANAREGTLLIQRLRDEGYLAYAVTPPRRDKKWDRDALGEETGWWEVTSEHGRDAARVAWQMGHLVT